LVRKAVEERAGKNEGKKALNRRKGRQKCFGIREAKPVAKGGKGNLRNTRRRKIHLASQKGGASCTYKRPSNGLTTKDGGLTGEV